MKAVLAALALVWAAMLWLGGAEGDRAVLAFLYAGDSPGWGRAAQTITQFGSFPVVMALAAIGALLLLGQRRMRAAWLLLFLPLSTGLIVELLKRWIGRVRPHDQEHIVQVQSYAFPSGHTANATVLWLGLALLLVHGPRARPLAIAAAGLLVVAIGLSRNMLGVHWPSDVVGGWALGLFWMLLLARLSRVPLSAS